MDSKRDKHRSSSSRSVENSKILTKSPPPRRGSVCQNQISRPTVQYAEKDGNNVEAEQFPMFIASQTFEQRKCNASTIKLLKNGVNPIEACRLPNETKNTNENDCNFLKSKTFGDPCCDLDMSERPSCSSDTNQGVLNDATIAGDCAAVVHNSHKAFCHEQLTVPMDAKINDNFVENGTIMSNVYRNETYVRIAPTMDPDDTYARVCSLGQPIPWTGSLNYNSFTADQSNGGSVSMPSTENPSLIEDEGWNPLFYEPVLVLCPKNENSDLPSSESGDRESRTTLCQQLQNWLAQGQANYLQKQKALELAKQEAAENAYKHTKDKTCNMEACKREDTQYGSIKSIKEATWKHTSNKESKMEVNKRQDMQYGSIPEARHAITQQQQQQYQQQQQSNNINQNLRYEQELQMLSSRNFCAPLAAPVAETRSTWSTKTSSWGIQKPMSYDKPQGQQTLIPKNENPYRNFGAFKSPVPAPTPSAFPDPYLWSVDSLNPFWIRDQRPAFLNVNDDDPFGLSSLPPKSKKKESTELVDAIKAGVGLLGPSPLEMYYADLRAGRPTTYEFYTSNSQANHMPKTVIEPGAAGYSMENIQYFQPRIQQVRSKNIADETMANIGPTNVVSHESSLQKCALVNSKVNVQQAKQAKEQAMQTFPIDNNRSDWMVVSKRLKKNFNNPCCTVALGKKSKSYTESTSLKLAPNSMKDNAGYVALSKKSLETISVEVLMNESTNVESIFSKPIISNNNDSDSDEFLSGIAEDDADFGEDSFKSCLQYPCDSSEGWNDSRSGSSLEDKHEMQSGASSSSISWGLRTPSELELNRTKNGIRPSPTIAERSDVNNNRIPQDNLKKPNHIKEPFHKETQSGPIRNKKKRTERFYSQVKVRSVGNSIFDLEATRIKLENFNLYIEPKGPSAMERLSGFEYTVETIRELLKYRVNSRPSLRGILSISQKMKLDELRLKNSNDAAERKFRYQKAHYPNGKPSIRAHNQLQNRFTDDANAGAARSNIPRFNPHWKSSKIRVIRQQQQQQQRLQLQQLQHLQRQQQKQQDPQQEQQQQGLQEQGFNEFPYQRTTVFTNSFHRNYHPKRACRKPTSIKSIMLHNSQLMQQKQQQQQQLNLQPQRQRQQQQPKGPNDSLIFETPFDLVPPSEPVNTRPMFFDSNSSSKDKRNTLTQDSVMDTKDGIQILTKKSPHS